MKFEKATSRFLMVLLVLAGLILANVGITGLPPTTLKGLLDTVKYTTFNFFVPEHQATKVAGGTLIETGNPNKLKNPGFEHQTASSGWTNGSTGSAVVTIAEVTTTDRPAHFGKKSIEVTCNGVLVGAGTCRFYQTVPTGGSFDYKHSIWAKADTAGKVRAYHVKDEFWTEDTGEGLSVGLDWKDYVFQRVSGSTHSGIGIEITVGAGEIVKVTLDEAVVGYNDPVSEQYYCDSIECETSFNGKVSPTGGVSEENLDFIEGNAAVSDTSLYTFTLKDGVFAQGLTCTMSPVSGDTGNQMSVRVVSSTASTLSVRTLYGVSKTAFAFTLSCQRSGTDFEAAKAKMRTKVVSTGAELFSTDTHTLSFKSTAITSSDPVGTYNTYSYAINSNTKTICTDDPDVLPTKADGFKIFTRAYNAASTCGNPARVEIKIAEAGTSLPTVQMQLYKNAEKDIVGSLDFYIPSTTGQVGARFKGYDETTGVLTVDTGVADLTTNTTSVFTYRDTSATTSGYLVINAQPAKTTQAMSLKEFDYVYVEAAGNGGESITASVTNIPFIETADTASTWNGSQFTAPSDGIYLFTGTIFFSSSIAAGIDAYLDGTLYRRAGPYNGASATHSISFKTKLEAGQIVSFRSTGGGTLSNSSNYHWLTITRIPGQF